MSFGQALRQLAAGDPSIGVQTPGQLVSTCVFLSILLTLAWRIARVLRKRVVLVLGYCFTAMFVALLIVRSTINSRIQYEVVADGRPITLIKGDAFTLPVQEFVRTHRHEP